MIKTNHSSGGAALLAASLGVMVIWLAGSCAGDSQAPDVLSPAFNPVKKAVSHTWDDDAVELCHEYGQTSIAIDPDDDYPAIAYYGYDSSEPT